MTFYSRWVEIPKAELHCHLDGVLDPAMLQKLVLEGHSFPLKANEFSAIYPIESKNAWINRYIKLLASGLANLDFQIAAAKEHVNRLKLQGVTYSELFISGFIGSESE